MSQRKIAVIAGAGPAGLTAAYEIAGAHRRPPGGAREHARHRRHRADVQLQGQPHRHRRAPVLLEGPARHELVVRDHAAAGQAGRRHGRAGPRDRLRRRVGGAPIRAGAARRDVRRWDRRRGGTCGRARSAASRRIPSATTRCCCSGPACRASTTSATSSRTRSGSRSRSRADSGVLNTALIGMSYMQGAAHSQEGRDLPRRLLRQPVRPAALRDVLPRLHGEGVGRAVRRDPRRLGRAAREGTLAEEGRRARGEGSALERLREGAAGAGDEPHHAVLLPEVRARPDVGDRGARGHEGRRRRSATATGSSASRATKARVHRSRSRGGRDGRALRACRATTSSRPCPCRSS